MFLIFCQRQVDLSEADKDLVHHRLRRDNAFLESLPLCGGVVHFSRGSIPKESACLSYFYPLI
jgi:hypothetical protein